MMYCVRLGCVDVQLSWSTFKEILSFTRVTFFGLRALYRQPGNYTPNYKPKNTRYHEKIN